MNSFRISCLLLFFGLSVHAADKFSYSGRYDWTQKTDKKISTRWTLQEWLEQKDRNRMMDLWLAMNSASPYEYFLGATNDRYTTELDPAVGSDIHYSNYTGEIGAYATIVGLQGQYTHTDEDFSDLSGSLNFRIAGNAYQGTHLILGIGRRIRDGIFQGNRMHVGNTFARGDLNLYLTRYFGLAGIYQEYFAGEDAALGTVTGSRTEAGAFIDFYAVRVFGNWFNDVQKNDLNGAKSTVTRTGVRAGLLVFF